VHQFDEPTCELVVTRGFVWSKLVHKTVKVLGRKRFGFMRERGDGYKVTEYILLSPGVRRRVVVWE
jgi:hypothetical protein